MADLPGVEGAPKVESVEDLARGKFIALRRLRYRDAEGVERFWESAERPGFCGAVLIIAWLRPSDRLLLIRQYRPPARGFVHEFPAGLVDAGETPEQAARRELREETGYAARAVRVGPPCCTTPGMSDENVYMIEAEIDENAPENADAARRTDFDAAEDIETIPVPRAALAAFYRDGAARGDAFDSKLAAYIMGLANPARFIRPERISRGIASGSGQIETAGQTEEPGQGEQTC